MKKILIVLLLCGVGLAQEKVEPPKPIAINANLKAALKTRRDALTIAQLEMNNLILQMRLILKVPNDYEWDDGAETFVPPVEKPKP